MTQKGGVVVMVFAMMVMGAVTGPVAAGTLGRSARVPRQVSLGNFLSLLMRPADNSAPALDTADLGDLAGYKVERHMVVTGDGYILTVHHIPPFANPARTSTATTDKLRFKRNHEALNNNFTTPPSMVREQLKKPKEDKEGKKKEMDIVEEELRKDYHEKEEKKDKEEFEKEEFDDDEQEYVSNLIPEVQTKVVFLQHGLMGSSDNWNTNTKDNSLAYLLSDAGYDVWMGNFRGNVYSRQHTNMTHNDPQFWKFSYDEMAKHDLPAMLEHVLVETGAEKVTYVGHSMGSTVFFAAMSSLPEYYQNRIAAMVALAPVATVNSISSPIKYFAPLVNDLHYLLRFFGNDQEVMTNRMLISLWDPYRVCRNYLLCENIQFMITGFDPSRADQSMVPIILSHNPAGSSTQTLFHFAQGYTSGRFQKFDFGKRENLEKYGQEQPPEYDISKIKVPITLFWADNDWLTGEEDISNLREKLPNLNAIYKVSNPIFSHLDFLWANDVRSLVYDKLLDILGSFTNVDT